MKKRLLLAMLLPVFGIAGYFAWQNVNLQSDRTVVAEEAKATTDHTMFGGTLDRNFVNLKETGFNAEFPKDPEDEERTILGNRVLRTMELGSRAYGGPTISGGKIFVGTNNERPRNQRDRAKPVEGEKEGPPIDKGILMCFEEATGKFLWQAVHDKLPSGLVNDWPKEGVCATPVVDGDRVYYTSNECQVICADVNGLANGNDGIKDEKYQSPTDADFIWKVDMMKDLNVFPHNMTCCSPLIVGDIIFVVTANGVDENHINIPFPEAPSFIALDKATGKLLWKSNLPGRNIMHGQWANPAYGVIKGQGQVIFPGGDGWIYSLKPETGEVLWKFDANPKDSLYELGGKGTKSDFIGTPVVYKDRVYIGTGQDPEHFEGIGHFWCIDASKRGDISRELLISGSGPDAKTKPNPNSGAIWEYGGVETRPFAKRDYSFGRTMSTACIVDDIIYIAELAGYVHCLDANTGKKYWQYDTKSAIWGSFYYVDGKVMLANEDGDVYIFKHFKKPEVIDEVDIAAAEGLKVQKAAEGEEEDKKRAGEKAAYAKLKAVQKEIASKFLLTKIEVGETVRGTPIIANGVLYIMSEKNLFAIKK
ncbi:MAG: PQQ-binding-like beta-propeller repeat protein [Zavarzinella sp.]